MDLYRYFHPQHNPRLRAVALRAQEWGELQLAASELHKALKRASIRTSVPDKTGAKLSLVHTSKTSASDLQPDSSTGNQTLESLLQDCLEFATNLSQRLELINEMVPEDNEASLTELAMERANAPGWETWCRLITQRLALDQVESDRNRLVSLNQKK